MQNSLTTLHRQMVVADDAALAKCWVGPDGRPVVVHLFGVFDSHGHTFNEDYIPVTVWEFFHEGSSKSRNPV